MLKLHEIIADIEKNKENSKFYKYQFVFDPSSSLSGDRCKNTFSGFSICIYPESDRGTIYSGYIVGMYGIFNEKSCQFEDSMLIVMGRHYKSKEELQMLFINLDTDLITDYVANKEISKDDAICIDSTIDAMIKKSHSSNTIKYNNKKEE